jgi:sulfate transport system substrate-binding protein
MISKLKLLTAASLLVAGLAAPAFADQSILNVSYDPTRELYKAYDELFVKHWADTHNGEVVTVDQSHGGSGAQARAVIDGQEADVVTLALQADVDAIAAKGLIKPDWQTRLPDSSAPYTSTIVFLVRKGNPKGVKDWDDLVKPGIGVITPNPKTSGGARWNYLAAWAYADAKYGGDAKKDQDFVGALYKNVVKLDSGARGSTTTFTQGTGDVLLSWENEAYLALKQPDGGDYEIVVPSLSIKAIPPVAVVDANVDKKGTRAVAEEYLKYLYSDEAQKLIAANFYRPIKPEAADPNDLKRFLDIKLATIEDPIFGGWAKVQKDHFDDGGIFDQIYKPAQ